MRKPRTFSHEKASDSAEEGAAGGPGTPTETKTMYELEVQEGYHVWELGVGSLEIGEVVVPVSNKLGSFSLVETVVYGSVHDSPKDIRLEGVGFAFVGVDVSEAWGLGMGEGKEREVS